MDCLRPSTLQEWHDWIGRDLAREPAAHRRERALLISYQFPPVGGSGVQRAAKLAKYLPRFGWEVEVLAADHQRFPWHDESLLDDLPAECRIHRLSGYEPACVARRAVSCLRFRSPAARQWLEDRLYWRLAGWAARRGSGNGESWWVRPAISSAHALHRRHPYNAVISTGPPHFVHAVALAFSRSAGIPWLADLRDPLLSDFDRSPPSALREQRQRRLERQILRHADAIVTTCETFADCLQTRYPARSASIRCIRNGFDRDDLRPHGGASIISVNRSRCTFLAAGSFYGRRELHRVLDPLAQVLARHPEWTGRVELRLLGTIDRQQRRELERNRPDWLTPGGYVNHREATAAALQADCSLVLVPDCAHGRMSIPGKTFELIALPRHVLGLVPAGSETARLLRGAGACTLAAMEDQTAVADAFERIITAHFARTLPAVRNWQHLDAFDRSGIAGEFASTLDEITPSLCNYEAPGTDAAELGAELILVRAGQARQKLRRKGPELVPDAVEAL